MTYDLEVEEELAQTNMSRVVLHRLLGYLRPYKWQLFLALFGELFWVISMAFNAALVQGGIDNLTATDPLERDYHGAVVYGGLFIANAVFRLVLIIFELRLVNHVGTQFLNNLRRDLFDHVQTLSMRYFDNTKEGRIICRLDRDVESLRQCMVWGPLIFFSAIYSLIVASVFMAHYNWKLWLAVASVMPILAITSWTFQRKAMKVYRIVREALSGVTAYAAETIQGVRALQGYSRQRLHYQEYCSMTDAFGKKVVRAAVVWNLYLPSISTCYAIAVVVILGYGGMLTMAGEIHVSELVAFVMLIGLFFWPIEGLGELYNHSLSAASSAERIFLLLDTEPEIVDTDKAIVLETVRGHIQFEDVEFSYDGNRRDQWALRDIDFDIPAGSTIALVGPTGSGKSSIINLATRFYDPLKGRVRIDGNDVRDVTLESLHANMGIVLQENFLFTGTVMENLLYGNETVTESTAVDIVNQLGADRILNKLSDGLQTQVLERGAGLSLGERQLICFARAMIADPAVLILDEATSAVDSQTEAVLQKALETLCENRTTLIVAHRLSTIQHADQILVLDHGNILERGTHVELMERRGRYFDLYQQYLAKGSVD